jgi:hypothetical protein
LLKIFNEGVFDENKNLVDGGKVVVVVVVDVLVVVVDVVVIHPVITTPLDISYIVETGLT